MQPDSFSAEQIRDFAAALRPRIAGDLRTDRMTCALYSTDASLYRIMPLGVLIPRNQEDVQAALEEAARFGIPVLPRGGGSSLAGQTVGAALVVDFTNHLNRILDVNDEAGTVRVESGLVFDELNKRLALSGRMIGPDPASGNRATIGGMVGNNATGTHSIVYGATVDVVESTRAFLADGSEVVFEALDADRWAERTRRGGEEGRLYQALDRVLAEEADVIRRDTPRHWRRSGGYRLERMLDAIRNPAHLMCGSEGTLAVVSEVTLRTVERPRRTALGVVHFADRMASLEAVEAILETGATAVELFDRFGIEQCRHVPTFAARLTFIDGDPDAVLITEYYGESESELDDRLDRLDEVLRAGRYGFANVRVRESGAIANVWNVRKEALGLMMGARGDHKAAPFVEDAAVPIPALPRYIRGLEALFADVGVRWLMYAHASAGCLHVRPFLNMKDARDVQKMVEISTRAAAMVSEFGGALSSEHGEGLARSWLSASFYGQDLYHAYRATKKAFDPSERLNPGKVTEAPPMTENLRISPTYRVMPLEEKLDFRADGGFIGMVEVCTGVGACRKTTGTMCPSYMVTREEEHSTRGRANALREAMSGTLGADGFTSKRLKEVLDLCVSCKACKAECPSAVDMAKLKLEWLDHYWKANRMPLRERLFAHLPMMSRRIAGPLAPMVNAIAQAPPVRALLARSMGIASERKLPAFAARPFPRWFASRKAKASAAPDLVLFHDTFNSYHDTAAAMAAVLFFEGIGLRVELGGHVCCGRTYLSKGLIDPARALARGTVEALMPAVDAGLPIVGLEPSCILSLRDEYVSLLPDDSRVVRLARHAFTFEEYVARLREDGRLDSVRWKEPPRRVVVHGHCHQKALGGMETTVRCLAAPGHQVEVVDSSCCGMAGSFGYEAEHLHWSIAMAERSLAPAVRSAGENAVVVAAGFSCRSQIEQTTGRNVVHPAELMAASLASD